MFSQFILEATNSTHVTHEVLVTAVLYIKGTENFFLLVPPIRMVHWGTLLSSWGVLHAGVDTIIIVHEIVVVIAPVVSEG